MNYLALCNSLHEKTGESGADLTAVTGLSGYQKKIATNIRDTWTEIQTIYTSWRFMNHTASPTVAINESSIDASDWAESNLGVGIDEYHKNTFSIYLTATGISDETNLIYVPWERWKEFFGITYDDGVVGRPKHFTIDPIDDTLLIGPVADAAYTLNFSFTQRPAVLTNTSDTPAIATALHEIIVWRALEKYGYREESKFDIEEGRRNYNRMLRRLVKRELPELAIGGPLA